MKLRQYLLQSGNRTEVFWLEDGRVTPKDTFTLSDYHEPEREWVILAAYNSIDAKDFKDGHDSKKVFGSIQGRSS